MDAIGSIENVGILRDVLKDTICNLYNERNCTTHLDSSVLKSFKEDIKNMIRDSDFDKKNIQKYLQSRGWTDERINVLLMLYEEHKIQLMYNEFISHIAAHGEPVTSFNWILKFVFGSSEMKALRYPLLQLAFTTGTSRGREEIFECELNKNMLAKFICVLESELK